MSDNDMGLKVGDLVVVDSTHSDKDYLARVSRLTPSGIIEVRIGSASVKFNRDGSERGGSTWRRRSIRRATEADIAGFRLDALRARVRRELDGRFSELTTAQCEAILAVLSQEQEGEPHG